MKISKKQLRRTIRKVILESFWNKYGQPVGSRFQGGPLYQGGFKPKKNADPEFHDMRLLLRNYQSQHVHRYAVGNELYLSGVWVKLSIGVLGEVSCHDGTEEPVKCTIKFQGDKLVFDQAIQLEEFLSEPELLKMQQEQTRRLTEKYGR